MSRGWTKAKLFAKLCRSSSWTAEEAAVAGAAAVSLQVQFRLLNVFTCIFVAQYKRRWHRSALLCRRSAVRVCLRVPGLGQRCAQRAAAVPRTGTRTASPRHSEGRRVACILCALSLATSQKPLHSLRCSEASCAQAHSSQRFAPKKTFVSSFCWSAASELRAHCFAKPRGCVTVLSPAAAGQACNSLLSLVCQPPERPAAATGLASARIPAQLMLLLLLLFLLSLLNLAEAILTFRKSVALCSVVLLCFALQCWAGWL